MNILPKKKWHVRTKENVARVRRDEAKAEEEERRRLERQLLAENERRLQALRGKAQDRMDSLFGQAAGSSRQEDLAVSEETGHVNLFQDLEREERKNLGDGNKEYEEEKQKEKQEWESKMGIQKYLGEGSSEFDKKGAWYEKMPMRKIDDVKEVKYVLPGLAKQMEEEAKAAASSRDADKKSRKRKREGRSSDESDDSSDSSHSSRKHKHKSKRSKKDKREKKSKKKKRKSSKEDKEEQERAYALEKRRQLTALREERMKRERAERIRTQQLLHPELKPKEPATNKRKYNSQFNPDLCRN